MAEYLSPGVFIQEIAGSRPVEGVSTSTAAFVGVSEKGSLLEASLVTNFEEFKTKYGTYQSGYYLAYCVQSFFNNGGGRCYVSRVANEDDVTFKAVKAGPITITNSASPHIDAFTITALNEGEWGNNIQIVVADSVILGPDSSQRFSIRVLSGLDLSGVGNVSEVDLIQNTLEFFDDLSLDSTNSRSLETVIKGNSNYIEAKFLVGYNYVSGDVAERAGTPPLKSSVQQLSGGKNGLVNGSSVSITGITEFNEALYRLDTLAINVLSVPDIFSITNYDEDSVNSVCIPYIDGPHRDRDAVLLIDPTEDLNSSTIIGFRNNLTASDNAALYFPWILVSDPLTGTNLPIPPSGAVAGIIARTDANRGVFKSPAGTVDGAVRSITGMNEVISSRQQDTMNPIGINVIRNISGAGDVVWGARTISSQAQWRYLAVRRLVIFIEQSLKQVSEAYVFEPNTPALWSSISRDFTGFLTGIWQAGGLFGTTQEQAFFVIVDASNNPVSSRDLGRLVIDVAVAPVKPAEFIIVRITQKVLEA